MRPFPVLFLVAPLLAFGQSATAQELAQDRAPRFLLALDSRLTPVDIDRTPLLGRRLSLSLDGVTIKEALGEIGRQSGLRLAYGDDLLPRNTRVHLRAEGITVVAALTDVLFDTDVDVVFSPNGRATLVRRPDHSQGGSVAGRVTDAKSGNPIPNVSVLLEGTRWRATTDESGTFKLTDVAPGSYTLTASRIGYGRVSQSVTVAAGQEATVDVRLEVSASPLDAVVVTGTLVPTEVKALPTPITVLTADDIARENIQRVDQVFRGDVPGAVSWDNGAGRDYLSTINVRGASSLSSTTGIKTFVDGVETADPLYVWTIDPNSIDRIEITRGPQASTLYGAGALNGVMQIFTKHGQFGLARPEVTAKVSMGSVGGFDGQSASFQTDNTVSVLGGGEKTSYSLGGSYRHVGEWVPIYRSTGWGVSAAGKTTQGSLTLSSSLRYDGNMFDVPWDTRFRSAPPQSQPYYVTHRINQQAYGVTASLQATESWQHTLTVGYDRTYDFQYQTQPRFTTPSDSFLYVNAQQEARISVLYHTDWTVRLGATTAATVTAGVNHDAYDFLSSNTSGATHTTGSLDGSTSVARTPWNNTGYFGQVQVSLAERLFLTAGLRADRDPNFGKDFGTAWSPRVGAAYTLGLGPATLKLRASYGVGIRPPFPGLRDAQQYPGCCQVLANPNLAPERQRGADGGLDIFVGKASLGMSYYNQRAIDLIEFITLPPQNSLPTYEYQNVSRVKNEGWEFEGHVPIGPVQVAGTYSITNSTVLALPAGYPAGGYQVGDPILGIPHTSAGATVTYSPLPRTTLTANMTLLGNWTNTDVVAFFNTVFGGQPYRGSARAYWMEYPAVTKFAIGASQTLGNGVTAFLRAQNVSNTLRFEQTNLNIPTPRSVLVGASVRY
jgi:outer membrane receptor protein involved in Fe transport